MEEYIELPLHGTKLTVKPELTYLFFFFFMFTTVGNQDKINYNQGATVNNSCQNMS